MFGIDFIRMKEIVKSDVRSILSEARGKKKKMEIKAAIPSLKLLRNVVF